MRWPRFSSAAVACSMFSASNSSQAWGDRKIVRPGHLAEAGLRRLRQRPQRKRLGALKRLGMQIAAGFLLEQEAEIAGVKLAAWRGIANDRPKSGDEQNFHAVRLFHALAFRRTENGKVLRPSGRRAILLALQRRGQGFAHAGWKMSSEKRMRLSASCMRLEGPALMPHWSLRPGFQVQSSGLPTL
jgi:hypothetical protein